MKHVTEGVGWLQKNIWPGVAGQSEGKCGEWLWLVAHRTYIHEVATVDYTFSKQEA